MTTRRLLYLFCLGVAVLFYIFDTGFFSFLLLILGLAFVPMELLISLPGLLGVRVTLAVQPDEVRGGAPITLAVKARAQRSFCSVKGRLLCQNLMVNSEKKLRFRLPVGPAKRYQIEHYGAAIGAVRFSVRKLWLVDAAGLFAFPLRVPAPVTALALPEISQPPPPLPEAALQRGAQNESPARPQADLMREYTDIREYRDGDSLRDIHWKLTAKREKLMVREGHFSAANTPQLCFDYHGSPETVAEALGRLEGLSNTLTSLERLHRVHWQTPDGALQSHLIDSQSAFDALLWTLLETPLPAEGATILHQPAGYPGPVLLVKADSTELYEDGQLKEVVE
ncbi:DUF58 domain-containing protein [Ruminococcaceae bacterium OttesenSCG-928-D13]|nr:DUF58 domain-containing protein [Ruminococcaceae bacterium OttesenSCG-928-D13]